jgi:hypothetical protein
LIVGFLAYPAIRPGIDVKVTVRGEDAARAGATSILIHSPEQSVRISCDASCPDVVQTLRTREGLVGVDIRGKTGACLLCSNAYVTSGMSNSLLVSGTDELRLSGGDAGPAQKSATK